MIKTYNSKQGLEIIIPLIALFTLLATAMVTGKVSWMGLMILLLVGLFITHLFTNTRYTIDNEVLYITCGVFYKSKIKISSITKISETINIFSSPATSIDRLEIVYGNYDSVQISPKDKKAFIEMIKSINPNVQVSLRKK